ncbi:MAG: hypothetical protein L3J13_02155, partial [Devosiaceae bacterium]|nr:hypothetical protein [Devosiaceae bacterium]
MSQIIQAAAGFFNAHGIEFLVIGSVTLLVYSFLRRCGLHFTIAICFAFSPAFGLWAYQNVLLGRWAMPI